MVEALFLAAADFPASKEADEVVLILRFPLMSIPFLHLALAGLGLLTANCSSPAHGDADAAPPKLSGVPPSEQPSSLVIAGVVLPAPIRPLSTTQGGHIRAVFFSQDQLVRAGDVLLKIGVGPWLAPRISYVLAPAAGEMSGCSLKVGAYLAAGVAYAHLTQSVPVHVRVAAGSLGSVRAGDTLRLLNGPPGLAGLEPVLLAITSPTTQAPVDSIILVLGGVRWPKHSAAKVRISSVPADLRQRPPAARVHSGITLYR